MTNQEFANLILNKYNKEFIPVSDYIGHRKPMRYKHSICEQEFERFWAEHGITRNLTCPFCGGSNGTKKTTTSFIQELNSKNKGNFAAISEYIGATSPIVVKCLLCGKEIRYSSAGDLLRERFKGCTECNILNNRYTHKQFLSKIDPSYLEEYTFETKYTRSIEEITLTHKVCGKTYSTKAKNILEGKSHCPSCNCRGLSKPEQQLQDFIKYELKQDFLVKKRPLDGKEIDIWFPERNFGIEFNGIYWHSEKKVDKNYHLDKLNIATSKGIYLMQFFQNDWEERPEIVKSKIAAKLGLLEKRVHARKCDIIPISFSLAKDFLNSNHIQGEKKGAYYLGAFFQGDLIAVMVLSKGFRMSAPPGELELSRFALEKNTTSVGLFSKFISYIKNKKLCFGLFSFADLLLVNPLDNVYLKSGFKEISRLKPDYKWGYNSKLFHKSLFQKSEIAKKFPDIYNPSKTETEMMHEKNYYKVFDCGKIKYELIF